MNLGRRFFRFLRKMAWRNRGQPYVPKPREISCEVRIISDIHSPVQGGNVAANKVKVQDFESLFVARKYKVAGRSGPVVDGNIKYMKLTLKKQGHGKAEVFESVRQAWCSSLCKPGYPFWLEAAEKVTDVFIYRAVRDSPTQVVEPRFFSLGSFYDRGSFVRHWSSEQDSHFIEEGRVEVEFEHDTKTIAIVFNDLRKPDGSKEIRVEFDYKQLENYVVVDENITKRTMDLYFPLQWPAKVLQGNLEMLLL